MPCSPSLSLGEPAPEKSISLLHFPIYDTILHFGDVCIATAAKVACVGHFINIPAFPFRDDSSSSIYGGQQNRAEQEKATSAAMVIVMP